MKAVDDSQTADGASEIPYRAEVLRKSLHLLALVIPLGMQLLGPAYALRVLLPICVLVIIVEWARVRSTAVATLIHRIFGFMMRPEEIPPIGAPVIFNGATWVLVSATALLLIYPLHIAIASLVMFMISDAAAALVGRPFGRHRWIKSSKTVEGSVAFFLTALLILRLFGYWSWPACATVAAIAALLEVLPIPVNDNLRVPLLAAGALWMID